MKINTILLALLLFGCNNTTKKKQEKSVIYNKDKVVLNSLPQSTTPYIKWKNCKNDSLGYLIKNFFNRKEMFINKSLDTLLNTLELPILDYNIISNYPPRDKEIDGIKLRLENGLSIHYKLEQKRSPVMLGIYFKNPMVAEDVYAFERINKFVWTLEAKTFYKNQIVKDIAIVEHKN